MRIILVRRSHLEMIMKKNNTMYDSLFNGKSRPLSAELQAEFNSLTEQAAAKVAAMTEEEKILEFSRIMGSRQRPSV
jgi:hypothetical protein